MSAELTHNRHVRLRMAEEKHEHHIASRLASGTERTLEVEAVKE